MATIYTSTLLSYSTINSMSTGDSKTVLLVAPHAYTSSTNRGYILGYDGSSVVDFTNDSSTAFADFTEIQTAVDAAVSNSNLKWTLTKTSSGYTLKINGYNPYATSNTTASWSTTTVTWTITNCTDSFSTGASSNDGVSANYSSTYMLRLHPGTISSTSYLNQGGNPSSLKFASGTGGWSPWVMYEVTESEGNTYELSYTITDGTVTDPTTNPTTLNEGDSKTISFTGNMGEVLKYVKVNGTKVTPTTLTTDSDASYTYTTNYSTYSGSLSDAFDNSDTSYVWTAESPSAGKYILVTFDKYVNISNVRVYCASSTDKLSTESVLQCSSNGTSWTKLGTFADSQENNFSDLDTGDVKYLRIYATTSGSYWIQLATVDITYTTSEGQETQSGTYIVENISEDTSVEIKFGNAETVYVKDKTGNWKSSSQVYQKTDSGWVEIEVSDFYTLVKNKKIQIKNN